MSLGGAGATNHPWTLDEEKSEPLLRQAVEAGITAEFFNSIRQKRPFWMLVQRLVNRAPSSIDLATLRISGCGSSVSKRVIVAATAVASQVSLVAGRSAKS